MAEKVRIRFRKAGDLRFLSHHDLMRLFERLMRRADIPFRSTEGFHPKPKMMFPSALALGIIGCQEVLEVELEGDLDPASVHGQMAAECMPGLEILSVTAIDRRSIGQACRATYFLPLEAPDASDLPKRIAGLLGATECWIERTRPQPRRINIRPLVQELELTPGGLQMTLQITPQGAARPDEVLQALGLDALLRDGAVLERTVLELADEIVGRGSAAVETASTGFSLPMPAPPPTNDKQRTTNVYERIP